MDEIDKYVELNNREKKIREKLIERIKEKMVEFSYLPYSDSDEKLYLETLSKIVLKILTLKLKDIYYIEPGYSFICNFNTSDKIKLSLLKLKELRYILSLLPKTISDYKVRENIRLKKENEKREKYIKGLEIMEKV